MKRTLFVLLTAVAVFAAGIVGVRALEAQAQAQTANAVKRTVLMRQDTSVPGREAVMVLVELPPGSAEGKHTHPADLFVYVLEGTPTMEIAGQPPRTMKAGDVFTVASGLVHEGTNTGAAPAKVSAVFFAEKGKPLTTPAP